MLILFDIDATLLTTSRAGVAAMGQAGRDLFGPDFSEDAIDFAGRLDPLIITDLLTAHDRPAESEHIDQFRAAYERRLTELLAAPKVAQPLPGVTALLDALRSVDGLTLGLLTGNFPETGRIKLQAAGIDPDDFEICVWGSDSPHQPPERDHLPPVGMTRYRQARGLAIDPKRVTIIGDTVHDIRCALVNQCRVLAVATGAYSAEDLQAAGAHRVVETLADTEDLLRWLIPTTSPATPG